MHLTSTAIAALDDLSARDRQIIGYSEDDIEEVSDRGPTGRRGIRLFVEDDAAAARMPREISGVPVVEVRAVGPAQNKSSPTKPATRVGVDPKSKVRPVVG